MNTSKRYYKIGEASEIIGVPDSTLRFWEREFEILAPRRSEGGTRYYTPADIEKLRMIQFLIRDRGMSIDAARREIKLNADGVARKSEAIRALADVRDRLQGIIDALHKFR